MTIFFVENTGMSDVIPVKGRGSNPAQEHEGPQPYFDADVQRNVTAIATQTAFLHCRVKDLGVKVVSSFFSLCKSHFQPLYKNSIIC